MTPSSSESLKCRPKPEESRRLAEEARLAEKLNGPGFAEEPLPAEADRALPVDFLRLLLGLLGVANDGMGSPSESTAVGSSCRVSPCGPVNRGLQLEPGWRLRGSRVSANGAFRK